MNHLKTLRGLIAGTAVAVGILAGAGTAAADMPTATPTVGCASTVQLQPLQFPTSAGQRSTAPILLPDDGGATPPTVTVVKSRTASWDELDVAVGSGEHLAVRTLYVAPVGCAIAWSHDVHPDADPGGRRSIHIPAFTLRLIPLSMPTCPACQRAV